MRMSALTNVSSTLLASRTTSGGVQLFEMVAMQNFLASLSVSELDSGVLVQLVEWGSVIDLLFTGASAGDDLIILLTREGLSQV